jgi:hypothetical protein
MGVNCGGHIDFKMETQGQLSEQVVMRDFYSSPLARALRTGLQLSVKVFFVGSVLFLAIPSSGPSIPVRTIPDNTRARSLATMISVPETDNPFTRYEYSWVAPPRFNWDYFSELDKLAGTDSAPESDPNADVEKAVSNISIDTPSPDTVASAFFVPDSFGASGWDFTVPDGTFVIAADPRHGLTPEPESWVLIGIGMGALALADLRRRKRQSGARQRV